MNNTIKDNDPCLTPDIERILAKVRPPTGTKQNIADLVSEKITARNPQRFGMGLVGRYAAVITLAFVLGGGAVFLLRDELPTEIMASDTLPKNVFTIKVPMGSMSELLLPDGSKVWLNAGSELSYPEDFNQKNRSVILSGEAFFDVAGNKDAPFAVTTGDFNLTVLGTKFNVRAYTDEVHPEVTLVEGRVCLNLHHDTGDIILNPMEKAVLVKEDGAAAFNIRRNINPAADISWKEGRLIFLGEKLENLAVKMERWYDVRITIESKKLAEEKVTGEFTTQSIEQALIALQRSMSFDYQIQNNKIIIR